MASLLLSGIGMHAHEYSQQQDSANVPTFGRLPYPLTGSAFSAPLPKLPLGTLKERHSTTTKRIRPLAELPRNNQHIPVVRFEEPMLESMSEDDISTTGRSLIGNTLGSGMNQTVPMRRRRRSVRTSTTFQLAQPAPTLSAKQRLLQIRPKLLLQLQQLPPNSRPIPAIDVLPSTQVVPRLIKRFPRMFRGKNSLGANDVMIMKCEEYEEEDSYGAMDNEPDEESLSGRELIAVICQMPRDLGRSHGNVEIVLKDGSVWTATPSENGLQVDFQTVDDHGIKTTARWVKDKRLTRRSTGGIEMVRPTSPLLSIAEFRFTFSIIDPTKRQHPIIATMTHTTLDIPDTYTTRTPSFESVLPLSLPTSHGSLVDGTEDDSIRNTFPVDKELRSLIQVTGIYVALCQGVSSYFKYSDLSSCSSRPSLSSRAGTSNPTPDPTQNGTPDSIPVTPDTNQVGTLAVLSGKYRDRLSPSNSVSGFDHPRRSMSAGGSYMQRALGRKAANPPSTIISDSEGEKGTVQSLNGIEGNESATSTTLLRHLVMSAPSTPTKAPRRRDTSMSSQHQLQAEPIGLGIQYGSAEQPRQLQQTQTIRHKPSRWKSFTNIFRRRSNKSSSK
ncbi:hypothetical protein BJ878DRAFT_108004 [Calycina marina]|uniref:Uncharacterized protein n=1 Tax=Calycina marina TaxID=1763456 RepID=A0A9P7Z1S7_9HELO|nr:hypothetical protein BJ878DRAFT_108004 [Calycina marina]